nr:unnamed protein product [Spirometra erinaceieuropaei]
MIREPETGSEGEGGLPDWERPLATSPVATRVTKEGLPDWGDRPYRPKETVRVQVHGNKLLTVEPPTSRVWLILPEEKYFVDVPRMQLLATMVQKCPFEDDVLRPDFEHRARQQFRALDKEKKGFLSLKDVWYGLEEEAGKNFTREEIEEIFGYIDQKKSGRIDEEEWLQAVKIIQ